MEENKTRDQGLKRHRAVPDNQQLNFLSETSSSNLMRNDAVLVLKQNVSVDLKKKPLGSSSILLSVDSMPIIMPPKMLKNVLKEI